MCCELKRLGRGWATLGAEAKPLVHEETYTKITRACDLHTMTSRECEWGNNSAMHVKTNHSFNRSAPPSFLLVRYTISIETEKKG